MALKSLFLVSLLLVGLETAPNIAQIGGLGNLLGGLINVHGILFCTANGNANGTSTPVFPNAAVQIQCGNTVVSSTATNAAGLLKFLLDPLTTPIIPVEQLCAGCQDSSFCLQFSTASGHVAIPLSASWEDSSRDPGYSQFGSDWLFTHPFQLEGR